MSSFTDSSKLVHLMVSNTGDSTNLGSSIWYVQGSDGLQLANGNCRALGNRNSGKLGGG